MTYAEKLADIKKNPEKHKHRDLNALNQCCWNGSALDLGLMQAHEGLQGRNGGRGCDVSRGPCSCGAWH